MSINNVQTFFAIIVGSTGLGGLLGAYFTYRNRRDENRVKWHERAGEEVVRLYERVDAVEKENRRLREENRRLREENLDLMQRIDRLENRLYAIEGESPGNRIYGPHDVRGGDDK